MPGRERQRRSGPWVLRAGLVLAGLIGALTPHAASAGCKGHDLLARMAGAEPAAYADLDREARSMPFGEGLLFRISHAGLAPSYLFGTLHVADPRLNALSKGQRDALQSSRRLVVETVEGSGGLPRARALLAAPIEDRAGAFLPADEFRRLRMLTVARGFPADVADRMKPAALALMLDLPPCAIGGRSRDSVPDAQVLRAARAAGIPVSGLESVSEQVSIADGLPRGTQSALLSAMLAQAGAAEDVVETSVTLYRAGTTGMLLAWSRSPRPIPGVAGAGIPAAFLDRIVVARSRRMRDRLLPLLAKGGVFVAVGAAHIPGQDGLGALLVEAGYRVERID